MPKIPEYESQIDSANTQAPRAYADPNLARHSGDGLVRAGREIQKAAGQFFALAERQDKLAVQKRLAEARSELTVAQQNAVRTGAAADPAWTAQFKEQVQRRLAGLTEGITTPSGRSMAQVYQTQLAEHFFQTSLQDHAVAAGMEQRQTFLRALEMDRNTVLNDPTQFGLVQAQHLAMLNDPQGPYSMVPPKDRLVLEDHVNKGLALSSVQGTIRHISPDEAIKQLNSGVWDRYIDADSKNTLLNQAESRKKAREEDGIRALRNQRFVEAVRDEKEANRLVDLMPEGLSNEDILDSKITNWRLKTQLVNLNNSRALDMTTNFSSDPEVVDALQRRIYAADSDASKLTSPSDIMQASADRKINFKDAQRLMKLLDQEKTKGGGRPMHEAALQAKKAFQRDPSAVLPGMAETAYYNWRKDFETAADDLRQKGEDPSQLWDPRSKMYMLSPEKLRTYAASAFTAGRAAMEAVPTAGMVVQRGDKSFQFKGGDPRNPKSWAEVSQPGATDDGGSVILEDDGG